MDHDFLDCVDQLFAAMFGQNGPGFNLKSGSALIHAFEVRVLTLAFQIVLLFILAYVLTIQSEAYGC